MPTGRFFRALLSLMTVVFACSCASTRSGAPAVANHCQCESKTCDKTQGSANVPEEKPGLGLKRQLFYRWVADVLCRQPSRTKSTATMVALFCGTYGRDSSAQIVILPDRATKTTGPLTGEGSRGNRTCKVPVTEKDCWS